MNCDGVRDQLSLYLDDVLSRRDREAVARHLDGCADCRAEFVTMRALERDLVCAFSDDIPRDVLWHQIERSLDEAEAATRDAERRRRPWWHRPGLAAAVLVAFAIMGGAWLMGGPSATDTAEGRLSDVPIDELRTFIASSRPLDVAATDPRLVAAWFLNKVDFAPPLPLRVAGMNLVGGRLCYLLGRRVASYMYEIGGHLASLYVMAAKGLAEPGHGAETIGGRRVVVRVKDGFAYVRWWEDGLHYALVSSAPKERLLGIVRNLAGAGDAAAVPAELPTVRL